MQVLRVTVSRYIRTHNKSLYNFDLMIQNCTRVGSNHLPFDQQPNALTMQFRYGGTVDVKGQGAEEKISDTRLI